jgi:hypothetical protein
MVGRFALATEGINNVLDTGDAKRMAIACAIVIMEEKLVTLFCRNAMTKSYAKTEAAVRGRANPASLGNACVKNPFTVLGVTSRQKIVNGITATVKVNALLWVIEVLILRVPVTVATLGRFVINVEPMVFLK